MTTLPAPLVLDAAAAPYPAPAKPSSSAVLRRLGRAALMLLLAVSLAAATLMIGLHAYIAWKLSHPVVAMLASNPKLAKNLDYSDVVFPSADGRTSVNGWWIPAVDSRQTVVLSHGYGANREESWVPMYDLADLLHGLQYNVLMFDYGFANASNPLPATGGVLESQQLLGAITFAKAQGSDELVVWGFSMGAGTALQAALRDAPIDAMILDSTFLPNEDTLLYVLKEQHLDLPAYPTLPLLRWFIPIVSGTSFDQIPTALALTTDFDFPILLIHGTADTKAPPWLAEDVAKAQTNPYSQLWLVKGAIHEMIFRTHKQEYVERTTAFLDEVRAANFAQTSGFTI